eukprot:TRINITY_DN4216_c0_g1_i7.p1 TRINITY_DN4216_c0_g1~~TRINITY_DN4216_c0_g1_i7.p1  ORF type:complete len:339 (+),score=82.35 TRINITY_DN4216_c0_g1_i7:758-1774(+)
MRDIGMVVASLMRGAGFVAPLRVMIAETQQFLIEFMENILDGNESLPLPKEKDKDKDKDKEKDKDKDKSKEDKSSKVEKYEKWLRFFEMIKMLSENNGEIERKTLIGTIFKEHPREIENYLSANIIQFLNKEQSTLQDKLAFFQPVKTIEKTKFLGTSVQNSINNANSGKNVNINSINDNNINKNNNSSEQIKIGVVESGQITECETTPQSMVLSDILNGKGKEHIMIIASTPRLLLAFQLVLNDDRILEQKETIDSFLKKQKTKETEKDSKEKISQAYSEWLSASDRLSQFVMNPVKWLSFLGENEYEQRKSFLLQDEKEKLKTLSSLIGVNSDANK